jgi:hypothetical protein
MMHSAGERPQRNLAKKIYKDVEIPVRIGSVDIVKEKDDFEKTWEKEGLPYGLQGMVVKAVANIHSSREHKEVAQRLKLGN